MLTAQTGMWKEAMHILSPYPLLTLPHYCFSWQKYIIDLTSSTAQKFIFDGKHEKALPAALHALRFSSKVYGPSSVQLLPAYLLLADACIGKHRSEQ